MDLAALEVSLRTPLSSKEPLIAANRLRYAGRKLKNGPLIAGHGLIWHLSRNQIITPPLLLPLKLDVHHEPLNDRHFNLHTL